MDNAYFNSKATAGVCSYQFVLVPAARDLTERADFEVEQRDLKRGRRITGFEFILRERSQGDVFPHNLEV